MTSPSQPGVTAKPPRLPHGAFASNGWEGKALWRDARPSRLRVTPRTVRGSPLDCREEVTTPGSALDKRFDGVNRELGKTPKTQT